MLENGGDLKDIPEILVDLQNEVNESYMRIKEFIKNKDLIDGMMKKIEFSDEIKGLFDGNIDEIRLFEKYLGFLNDFACTKRSFKSIVILKRKNKSIEDPEKEKIRAFLKELVVSLRKYEYFKGFIPSDSTITSLNSKLSNHPNLNHLKNMYLGLVQTHKELVKQCVGIKKEKNLYDDYVLNPPLDIVRDFPLFEEYAMVENDLITRVVSEGSTMVSSLKSCINDIKTMYDNSIPNYSDDTIPILNEISHLKYEKLLLKYQIRLMKDFPIYDCSEIKGVLGEYLVLQNKFLGELMKNKNSYFDYLQKCFNDHIGIKNKMEKQKYQLIESLDKAKERIEEWIKSPVIVPDESLIKEYNELRSKCTEFEGSVFLDTQKYTMKVQSGVSIQQDLFTRMSTVVPSIESMHKYIERGFGVQSVLDWKKKSVSNLENQILMLKKRVQNRKQQIKGAIDERELNRALLEQYKQNKNDEIRYIESSLFLSGTENRDIVLIPCGHTFSSLSIQPLLNSRKRKCPVCKTRFSQSDIQMICWK